MTATKLKSGYRRNNPEGHFFDRETMRFFGDTVRNFGVHGGVMLSVLAENGIECVPVWSLYRKRPVKGGMYGHCAYFRKDSFEVVFNHE
jgi:hypothetical protein